MAAFGWNVVTNLAGVIDTAFDLAVTLALMLGLVLGVIAAFALGQAQVLWAQIALSIALLLGPIFIPWLLVPQLSSSGTGCGRVLVYSLSGAVAGVAFRIVAEIWGEQMHAAWHLRPVTGALSLVVLVLAVALARPGRRRRSRSSCASRRGGGLRGDGGANRPAGPDDGLPSRTASSSTTTRAGRAGSTSTGSGRSGS